MNAATRLAGEGDVPALVDLSRRVQEHLSAAGSRQMFGPLPHDLVASKVAANVVWVLEVAGEVCGGVFVEPITRATLPDLATWGLDESRPLWYLSKLMVAPELRGRGLGHLLVERAQRTVAAHPAALLVLDCWAGNDKLRDLYTRAGFVLHGIFPEQDYQVAVFTWSVSSIPPQPAS